MTYAAPHRTPPTLTWLPPRATPGAAVASLERTVRERGTSPPVVTAAIVLAHLRGALARADVGMVLVDALLADAAPRAALTDALTMLGPERGVALLRRALRGLRDEDAVREVGDAMVALALRGGDEGEGAALERHLCLATLARHPTLWGHDVRWLAARGLPCTREAMEGAVRADA